MWYNSESWRKTISFALSTIMITAFVSCGKSNKPIANSPDTAKATGQTISMATFEPTSTHIESTTTSAVETQTTAKTKATTQKSSRKTTTSQTTEPTSSDNAQETVKPYDGFLGSARSLDGITVVFSVFASDLAVKWDEDSQTDAEMMKDTLDNLWRGTSYLRQVSEKPLNSYTIGKRMPILNISLPLMTTLLPNTEINITYNVIGFSKISTPRRSKQNTTPTMRYISSFSTLTIPIRSIPGH